ncbi:TPA: hypothetical protein PET91_002788 [Staphylococcus aureus]|nr:hypothetical protein [Staphylococcus aureus]HDF7720337.1 hypothetical protein [Staphylococcus aureus]HDG4927134.1 hypothetical protein [Staphylococcus aureus]HDI5518969.1 hypothetical protein [Staphylococcus aureus]
MIYSLKNTVKEFEKAEEKVQKHLDGLVILGNYKEVLKEIMNIDEQVFEMLYDDDAENRQDYEFEPDDLIEAQDKLHEITSH